MKRLYEVRIEKIVYVAAEDEDEAELEAQTVESEETGEVQSCEEIRGIEQVPEDWRDALPWNNDGRMTIRQILEQPSPPEKPYDHPDQMKLGFPAS